LRCPEVFEDEITCGGGGRAVPEAVEILRRWNCEAVASLFIVDDGNVAGEASPIPMLGDELSIANTNSDELYARQRKCEVPIWYWLSLREVLSSTMMLSCSTGTHNFGRVRPRPF
jgi:hypothetical protein